MGFRRGSVPYCPCWWIRCCCPSPRCSCCSCGPCCPYCTCGSYCACFSCGPRCSHPCCPYYRPPSNRTSPGISCQRMTLNEVLIKYLTIYLFQTASDLQILK